jgi:periplasmic divalent cation tolerance protein
MPVFEPAFLKPDILVPRMTDKIVVLTTCASAEQAELLARYLVEHHLAACVNIVPGARSIYRWKDKVEADAELVLIIKTRRDRFAALRAAIEKIHTYEVPEIVAIPVVDGSAPYLAWLDRELGS